jgi:hypothetical protein
MLQGNRLTASSFRLSYLISIVLLKSLLLEI